MNTLVAPKSRTGTSTRFERAPADRDTHNPLHWMPVPMPGLSVPQLQAFMQEVDRKPYSPPLWLQIPQAALKCGKTAWVEDRDPKNPMHWMPLPPPAMGKD